MRVATVITRLEGGAGAQALRGARTLNQDAFEIVVISSGSGSDEAALCDALRAAYAAGPAPIAVSSANWPSPTLG